MNQRPNWPSLVPGGARLAPTLHPRGRPRVANRSDGLQAKDIHAGQTAKVNAQARCGVQASLAWTATPGHHGRLLQIWPSHRPGCVATARKAERLVLRRQARRSELPILRSALWCRCTLARSFHVDSGLSPSFAFGNYYGVSGATVTPLLKSSSVSSFAVMHQGIML